MISKRKLLLSLFVVIVSTTFLSVATPAFALSFEDIVTGAKTFLTGWQVPHIIYTKSKP